MSLRIFEAANVPDCQKLTLYESGYSSITFLMAVMLARFTATLSFGLVHYVYLQPWVN